MRAELHRGPVVAKRAGWKLGSRAHDGQVPKARVRVLEPVGDVGRAGIRAREPVCDAAERSEPKSGAGERDADAKAAAFLVAAQQSRDDPEGEQMPRAVVERLRGERLRHRLAGRLRLRVVEPARRLHQAVEAAAPRPGTCEPVGRERRMDDPGIEPRHILDAKSVAVERPRPVGLKEHVRRANKLAEKLARPLLAKIEEGGELSPPGVDHRGPQLRQVGCCDREDIGPEGGQRPARDGARDHARQVEHAHACERA